MNKEDIKKVAKMIAETEPRSQTSIKNDIINWSYYNNNPNKKKYEYLVQKGKARLPMYTVHIPCQRPICDTLISQQARRTWQFSVVATDKESIKSKWEAKQKGLWYFSAKDSSISSAAFLVREYIVCLGSLTEEVLI